MQSVMALCGCVTLPLLFVLVLTDAAVIELFLRHRLKDNLANSDAAKVKVAVYIEALCPDCERFFRDQLASTWAELKEIMEVEIYPYGNAKESPITSGGYQFTCQHGPRECYGNTVLSCAQQRLSSSTFVNFSLCVMEEPHPDIAGAKCASQLCIPYSPIATCAGGEVGQMLLHAVGEKTRALQPPHTYVPWIVVNGVHTEDIQNAAEHHLKDLVCSTYKGAPPDACGKDIIKIF